MPLLIDSGRVEVFIHNQTAGVSFPLNLRLHILPIYKIAILQQFPLKV